MGIIDFIVYQFHHNQFFTAAILATPAAAITFSIRKLPFLLYNRIKRLMSLNVRFNSDKAIYKEAMLFITEQVIREQFTRNYIFSSRSSRTPKQTNSGVNYVSAISNRMVEIGYGVHVGFFKRKLVVIYRSNVEASQDSAFKEFCSCTFFTRNKSIIREFLESIEQFTLDKEREEPGVDIRVNRNHDKWVDFPRLPLRPLESVFIPGQLEQYVVEQIRRFDDLREFNHRSGIPHHLGILLHGVPGTGKSSLAHAIASSTGRTIYYLNLSMVKDLNDLISNGENLGKALMVIEDIDAARASVKREETGDGRKDEPRDIKRVNPILPVGVTLSELLNMLDGLMSPDGVVVLATTNHIGNMDPALLRPGRFDICLEIKPMGRAEFDKMASFFNIDPSTYSLPYFHPTSGAMVRKLLLESGVKGVEHYQQKENDRLLTISQDLTP